MKTQPKIIGRKVIRLEQVTSTNDAVRKLAEYGEPEGTVISAEQQTAGRGRLNRRWLVPPHTSLQFSLLLRPQFASQEAFRLVQIAGLSVADALAHIGLQPQLKWPNDVLLNEKKCAGILIETALGQDRPVYVILGIGVNVNFAMSELPDLAEVATTVSDALGRQADREALFESLLARLDGYYRNLTAGQDFGAEWKRRLLALGKPVRLSTPSGFEEGILEDVQSDGALILKSGERRLRFYAGDVTVVK